MIRRSGVLAAALLAWGPVAVAQDAPPPGCRWQGQTLACKDGKGHWRRAGDDEIVGTYPLGDLRPKPNPVAKAKPPPPVVAAPVVTAPPPPELVAAEQAAAPAASVEPAPPPVPAAASAPEPAPIAEPPPARKSWWRRWLDDIWSDLQAILRWLGFGR